MGTADKQTDVGGDGQVDEEIEAEVGWRYTVAKVKRDTTARWGMYIVIIVMAIAAIVTVDTFINRLTFGVLDRYWMAENLLGHHPTRIDSGAETRLPPAWYGEGTWTHPLGTDIHGRDYLTRLIYGTRVSVTVGVVATGLGLVGGTIIGAIAGYYGGWTDHVLMRGIEIVYSIPALILVIVFTVFVSGNRPDVQYAVIGVGIAFIPVFARMIRSRVVSVREMEYVQAAKAAGIRDWAIIYRHVIPNSFAPVLVLATLQIGVTILIVAGLSFLGYGAQPPTPDWGQMLNTSRGYMLPSPWLSIWPGLAILITIMGFNLLGDGLQDALDPRIEN